MEAKKVRLALFGQEGAAECADCSNPCCCWVSSPVVTPHEAAQIANATGLRLEDITERREVLDRREILYLNEQEPGVCRFLDHTTKKCNIYRFRPADCRLFPLDLDWRNGHLRWITYDVCDLAWKITEDDVQYAEERVLPKLGEYLIDYAYEDSELYDANRWIDLGEVRFSGR